MNQDWFEMKDFFTCDLNKDVWIPLRSMNSLKESGKYGYKGYEHEFFGVGSLLVNVEYKSEAEKLTWSDIGIDPSHRSCVEDDGTYHQADINTYKINGLHPVLEQHINSLESRIWHLHQDIVIALGLKYENNSWISPNEDYQEVVRIKYDSDHIPVLLEIKNEFLKDYLCARKMGLYITTFRERSIVTDNKKNVNWKKEITNKIIADANWQGHIMKIHEGGMPFDQSMAVFHMSRTDVNPDQDVPVMGLPDNNNVKSETYEKKFKGKKLYRISGELWKNYWISQGELSERIKGDKLKSTISFIKDASGTDEESKTLAGSGRWLWFQPQVMPELYNKRGGALKWYTKNTGSVRCSPDYDIHFGINKLGQLVTENTTNKLVPTNVMINIVCVI